MKLFPKKVWFFKNKIIYSLLSIFDTIIHPLIIIGYMDIKVYKHATSSSQSSTSKQVKVITHTTGIDAYYRDVRFIEKRAEDLITKNLRLVISIARQLCFVDEELSNLIQEGNLGLIQAVRSYDESKGAFAAFAIPYIKGYILNFIDKRVSGIRLSKKDKQALKDFDKTCENDLTLTYYHRLQDSSKASEVRLDSEDCPLQLTASYDQTDHHLNVEQEDWVVNKLLESNLSFMECKMVKEFYGLCGCEQNSLNALSYKYHIDQTHLKRAIDQAVDKLQGNSIIVKLHRAA
ncbi:RNA polymerase sigma factor, sigma-70 family [Segatella bryantii]|jgi:RNA polymerase sigma factor (sigma-70 family)|nr:RNA polymerase sigma factor, sigma-70 family [Segatella bryantii]